MTICNGWHCPHTALTEAPSRASSASCARSAGGGGAAGTGGAANAAAAGLRAIDLPAPETLDAAFHAPFKGDVDVIQGITEITPQWTKVEGITYMWDMRIATSSASSGREAR